MKPVVVHVDRPSGDLVCYIDSIKPLYPANWSRPIPEYKECCSVDEIKAFITETKAELVLFGFSSSGIPNRPVKVSDAEKLDKALKAFGRMMHRWAEYSWEVL